MKYFFVFLLIIITKFPKFQSYCDSLHFCNNCSYSGFNNYNCTCDLYIYRYCLIGNPNQLIYGCYKNEGEQLQGCGEPFLYIKNGDNYSFNFNTTNKFNYICYYKVIKQEYNPTTNLTIRIQRNENYIPPFNLFLLIYDNNYTIKNDALSDVLIKNSYLEENCQNLSIYLDFENRQNNEKLSLIFSNGNSIEIGNSIKKYLTSSQTGLSIGLIIGGIALILVIITIIIIIIFLTKNKTEEDEVRRMKEKKAKVDKYFKELKIKIYDKNIYKDCPKCILCNNNFNDNNLITTTTCAHTFHEKCFRNFIMTNFTSEN